MKIKELRELLANADDEQEIVIPQEKQVETVTQYVPSDMATYVPVDGSCVHIKHACNLGDIIASLAAVKRYYDILKRKAIFFQRINMPASYYQGATHGTLDESGNMVTLNKPLFEMMKPLLESQPYIEKMEIYEGQSIHLDFDVIRGKTFANLPHGSIQAWLFYAFPDLAIDISKPWMFLPEQRNQVEEVTKGKVIINFTERYRNGLLEFYFLKQYTPDLIFAGTEKEYWTFCNQFGLTIPRLEVDNFLESAYALRGCRFLYSNQSFLWNLATALGIPRVVEVCQFAQNCLPFYGENSYGYFHQVGAEYYFRRMYNETINK